MSVPAISFWRQACTACALLCLAFATASTPAQVVELRQAQRIDNTGTKQVELPDLMRQLPDSTVPLSASYQLLVELDTPPRHLAIWLPGLIAHARLRLNGHVLFDRLDDVSATLPRGSERMRLVEVPDAFVRPDRNLIEIDVAGHRLTSLSHVVVGERAVLERLYLRRLFGVVVGPAIVAVVVGSLALCVLLLWVRRGDALYGYFGLGSLFWAIHTAWSVMPETPLTGAHLTVWWTTLYGLFVAMLVIFCVRFAGWHWPRFDRGLTVAALSAPLVLYAAERAGSLDVAQEAWLLGCIAAVAVGLVAVGRYVWTHRNTASALLLLTGVVSMAFGVYDWLVNHEAHDNNPVFLVPYAGLLFVVLVAWMLIDRFVAASRELEAMNLELEQRVATKSAELSGALVQMRDAKEHAEAANRTKTSFLAAASHDLRQPIHALGLYMQALAEQTQAGAQPELVQRMKASLAALESMFNALLDISRMDAGVVVPDVRPFALQSMLHRVADEFVALAADKGLRLSVRMSPPAGGPSASSDPMLVERVVTNLLGNAMRYTTEGGVLLSCRLRRGNPARWLVEVWDTGPGIAAAEQERVFEEFYQLGNLQRDRSAGLGLGLSIVRRLCDLLGHRLRLVSRPGRGTRFMLELPATDRSPALPEPELRHRQFDGFVVAVVEDDAEVRASTQLLLERWGCRVHAGADAAEVLASDRAGATLQSIVADFRLRDGHTGIEAIQALRTACGRELPAVIVSGDSSPQQLAQVQASGFECLGKPVAPQRLRGWLSAAAAAATPGATHDSDAGDLP